MNESEFSQFFLLALHLQSEINFREKQKETTKLKIGKI